MIHPDETPREHATPPSTARYGCHCDVETMPDDFVPDGCVFDSGDVEDCTYAMHLQREGKGRNDCAYWKPIALAAAPAQETEHERIRRIVGDPRESVTTTPRPGLLLNAAAPAQPAIDDDALVAELRATHCSNEGLHDQAANAIAVLRAKLQHEEWQADIEFKRAERLDFVCAGLQRDMAAIKSDSADALAARDAEIAALREQVTRWQDICRDDAKERDAIYARAERAEAELARCREDAGRRQALCNLWMLSTVLTLTMDEDGRWSIAQTEAVDSEVFATLTGDTPDDCIDAARGGEG